MEATDIQCIDGDRLAAASDLPADDAVIASVCRLGYAVVPDFLDLSLVKDLSREFDTFHTEPPKAFGAYPPLDHLKIRTLTGPDTIREAIADGRLTALQTLLHESDLEEYVAAFYGADYRFPYSVFFAHSAPAATPITQLPYVQHFDKLQKLKFFVFLDDVDICHGPTWVVPESQIINRRKRVEWQAGRPFAQEGDPSTQTNRHHEGIDNLTSFDEALEIPLTSSKGTLVILDTDISHRAGQLSPGCERRAIRIDSASSAYSGVHIDNL